MITVEELQKLKLANTIIDRGSRKLGVRPLYASAVGLKKFNNSSKTKAQNLTNLNQVANKLSQERKSLNNRVSTFKRKHLLNGFLVFVSLSLIYFGFLVFNPSISSEKSAKIEEKIFADTVVDRSKPLIITTGAFTNEESAEKFKQDLSERLGVPLQIIKDKDKFIVQIGPSYQSHDDALLVFDELSQYSIGKLSLRFAE